MIAVKRRCGLGTRILDAGIQVAKEKLHAESLTIEAQVYARKLYENAGFVQVINSSRMEFRISRCV